ncbi:hypothetical protein C0L86_28215 [Streptomyces sp. SCA2-2]|nr:hypothetical protein C0L86_28215 [Streptomyces sp. SCA2-2]
MHARHSGPSPRARTPRGRRMARTGDLRGAGLPGARAPAALAAGYGVAFWWALVLTAAAIPLCLPLPGGGLSGRHPRTPAQRTPPASSR